MTATETKLNKDGTPRKAMTRGVVASEIFEVEEMPEAPARTRSSDIDATLATLATDLADGKTVCIRQYEKKESANGTLYNLRERYNGRPAAGDKEAVESVYPKLKGKFEFNIRPLDKLGKPGMTGIFVTKVAPKAASNGQPQSQSSKSGK